MDVERVWQVYFSPTGGVERATAVLAEELGRALGAPVETFDFTLPQARTGTRRYGPGDLVVFGTPVYAGRVPNKILPFVQEGFLGEGALAVPVAVFGNRSFDDALAELRNTLEGRGFHTVAGAAVAARHAFSQTLAREGKAVVLVLHDLCLALRFAHRGAVLSEGRLLQTGTPEELFSSGILTETFRTPLNRIRTEGGWRYYYD